MSEQHHGGKNPPIGMWAFCGPENLFSFLLYLKKNIYFNLCIYLGASLVAQTVKSLPEMQETQVRSLHWEDPLEKDMASHLVVPGLSCGTQAA